MNEQELFIKILIKCSTSSIVHTAALLRAYVNLMTSQRRNSHPGSPGAPGGPPRAGGPRPRGKEKNFLFTFRLVIKRIQKNIKILNFTCG